MPQLMGCCPQVVNLLLANVWLLQSVLVYLFPLCSCTNFSRDIHQFYHNCCGYMSSTQVGAHSADVGVDALGYLLWTYWIPFLHGDPAKLAAHGIQSSLLGGSHDQSQHTSRDVHDGSALSPMKWNTRWVALLKSPENRAGKGHLQCCPMPGQRSPDPPQALSRSIGEDIGHAHYLEAYSTTSNAERRHDRCCAIAALIACTGSTLRPGQTCQFAMYLCPTRMRQLLDIRSIRGCQWPSIRPTARGPAFSSCMLQVRRIVP